VALAAGAHDLAVIRGRRDKPGDDTGSRFKTIET